ncbi:MAG: B12-binding domain-containing radical SAM protein, partial [Bacteroidetes bacterium]|nr:B12-binding domain-containing radical SAM protein [Bacteroidota bacterium]
ENWERRLIDLNVKPLRDSDIEWADMVFLSAMNVQEESVRKIIAQCKRKNATIVAGGPLFTHEHERFDGIAHFVLNEAEITLPLFLADLKFGQAKPIYKSPEFADVSQTPLPQMELIDMKDYMNAIIQYSRGCPYLCDFCDVTTLYGRKPRTKSVEQIIAELEAIRKAGETQSVLFADDNLIGNKKILKSELLPALIEWQYKTNPGLYFMTQLTINLADDDEMMQLMLEAKFRNVFIGIETPQADSLKFSLKNQNLKRDLLGNIHKLHQAGFTVMGGFIVGFDTDKDDIFKNMIDFIQESEIPIPIVNVLKAPPGTALFDRMKREGRLSRHFTFSEGETNIIPVMGAERLKSGFLEVISGVYPADYSYKRVKRFLKTHEFPKNGGVKVKEKYSTLHLYHIVKAIIKLAIFDKDGKYYRDLLLWTYKNKRRHLSLALMYGMMLYQLRENYKQIVTTLSKSSTDAFESHSKTALLAEAV